VVIAWFRNRKLYISVITSQYRVVKVITSMYRKIKSITTGG